MSEQDKKRKSPEERAEQARMNGRKGGRPYCAYTLPSAATQAIVQLKMLKEKRLRQEFKTDKDQETADTILDMTTETLYRIALGKMASRRAPSAVKAAIRLRDELCEPLVKETKVTGEMTLSGAVAAAAMRIADQNKKKE